MCESYAVQLRPAVDMLVVPLYGTTSPTIKDYICAFIGVLLKRQCCLRWGSALTGWRLPSLAFVVPYIGARTKTLSVAQFFLLKKERETTDT